MSFSTLHLHRQTGNRRTEKRTEGFGVRFWVQTLENAGEGRREGTGLTLEIRSPVAGVRALSLPVPVTSRNTRLANLPAWGQLKRLAQEGTDSRERRQSLNAGLLSLAMLAVTTVTSSEASNGTDWSWIPNPPLNRPAPWAGAKSRIRA